MRGFLLRGVEGEGEREREREGERERELSVLEPSVIGPLKVRNAK